MKKPITGEEREKFSAILQPIADLKPGDKVQWKRGMSDFSIPLYDETVEVFRLVSKSRPAQGNNHDYNELDFTILFQKNNGEIVEYAFDSRRFERVL